MRKAVAFLLLGATAACTQAAPPVSSPTGGGTPSANAAYTFAVIGDWGAGTEAQSQIATQLCGAHERTGLTDVVTVGDNFYNPDGRATQSNFYRPMRCVLPWVRWRATWGNHDVAGSSTQAVLGAAHRYKWSSHGADFFMLDSNVVADDAQTAWLEAGLRASTAAFKVVAFHHPGKSVGGVHPPDQRVMKHWIPLFERYGVTLVLNGHEHDYEHFLSHGVHYVVTGGGGAITYGCGREDSELLMCRMTHEFLLVSIDGTTMKVTAVLPSGDTLDEFEIAT